jgi:hypothetical protein
MSKQGLGGKRNSQAFKELYMKFQHVEQAKQIPLGAHALSVWLSALANAPPAIDRLVCANAGAEKLQVLLTGQWRGQTSTISVLDGGQAWRPGVRRSEKKYRNNARRFVRVWGSDAIPPPSPSAPQ